MRRFPEVDKDGFVWLDQFPYVHDPKLDVREHYHDRKLAGAILIFGMLFAGVSLLVGYIEYAGVIFAAAMIVAFIAASPEKEDNDSVFIQNEPAQLSFNKEMCPGSIGVTGDTIKTYADSQHLKRLVSEGMNLYALLALLAIVGMVILGIALFYAHAK